MNEKIKAWLRAATGEQMKKWLLPVAAALAVTVIVVALLWQNNNHYTMLYGSQENIPIAQVVEVLSGEQISYRVEPNSGNLLVRESDLPKARMALAAKGVAAHSPAGYELMDKEELLGSSQFVQNVRFRRSLEGELAQSIMALDAVEFARVHLGISETSSFVLSNKPDSSASVMLRVRFGKQLSDDQVAAIVNLVAGSVPGMKLSEVRVVDQRGTLLSSGIEADGNGTLGNKSSGEVLQRLRQETERNLANVLTPVVGSDNFRISVVPRINFSVVEETQERFLGEPRASSESIQQENTTEPMAIGVPGSLSNRPVNQATAAASSQLATRNQAQRQFNYDRDVRHIRHPGWQLEKLSVAVVLNHGAPAVAGWNEESRAQVVQMLNQAAGIDAARGDVLTLSELDFPQPEPFAEPPVPWWEQQSIIDWVQRGGIALLAAVLLLFGVLPMLRRIGRRDDIPMAPAIAVSDETEKEPRSPALPAGSFQEQEALPPQGSGLETKVAFLQTLAHSETDRVAEVIKQWISSNERSSSHNEK